MSTQNNLIILLCCCWSLAAIGQETKLKPTQIKPSGFFLKDSLSLGERVFYTLSVRHPADIQILFPDSTYDYKGFELLKKTYYPTSTAEGMSLDSAVYEFTVFEIAPYYTLRMPVYVLNQGDSLLVSASRDSIYFKPVVPEKDEDLDFKADTKDTSLPSYFNYPYLVLGIFLFFAGILAIWGLLGNQLRRLYILFQFRARHQIFLNDFARLGNRIKNRENISDIEQIIGIWKKHLEFLIEKPFSSYTSKEIVLAIPDQDLSASLKSIDRALYGQEFSEDLSNSLEVLKKIATKQFEKKQIILKEV